ncbi:MAG: NAD(P)/FAD-dependent oxidoreductase [Thermoplasmata archaeon]
MKYDAIVVGAGPAGIFAAEEILKAGKNVVIVEAGADVSKRVCPMETGSECLQCEPCHIMAGVGGAGTFSDGILNLRPDIGGDIAHLCGSDAEAHALVKDVDEFFAKHAPNSTLYQPDEESANSLARRAAAVGARFIPIPQRHIGSDHAPQVIEGICNELKKNGLQILTETRVKDILVRNGGCEGVVLENNEILKGKAVVIAPGRVGMNWMQEIIERHSIKARHGPIDIGVRVEVPSIVMEPVIKINRDPKFHIFTNRYDDFVRTFCTNYNGFVVKENYGEFIGVNGHSMKTRSSQNTNFAFLVRIELTEPVENTTAYGRSIAELATTIGGGKPIVQRLGDLMAGRRSTFARLAKNPLKGTLTDVTPGDISMALPSRIVQNILEGLEKLNQIVPGVATESTLLYAPEIKFYAMIVEVNRDMETSIPNLFAAGDGVGLSRGIVGAAATGILAGRGVVRRLTNA